MAIMVSTMEAVLNLYFISIHRSFIFNTIIVSYCIVSIADEKPDDCDKRMYQHKRMNKKWQNRHLFEHDRQ